MAEQVVHVAEVKALKTRSGNTRFVLRADDGSEYTTFKEAIARQAVAAEGKRARIEFHEQERDGFRNVYLDRVVALDEGETSPEAAEHAEEVAWKTAVDAAPWLVGDAPAGGVPADELYEKLEPFKQRVAQDIREDEE
jgi:predicted DNA-binding transcriptional regulator YafY